MRIAAAQVRSPWLDPEAGTAKVLDFLHRAAGDGVELVAFPETFLPGYPIWLSPTGGARFNDPFQKAAYAAYLDAAVTLDGPALRSITTAVRDLRVFTYLGVAERVGHTVHCTLLAIDPDRGIVSAHRKLMPTYEERLVWGIGDGHGLRTTTSTESASVDSAAGRTGCRRRGMRSTPAGNSCIYPSGPARTA